MKSRSLNYALLWFGAAISIAEIITGTFFAPLGIKKGILAIVIGHLIGGGLLFLAAYMGAKLNKSSMESVEYSFGLYGSKIFALFNVVQLIGWTSVMIYDSGITLHSILNVDANWWKILVGLLVILWILPNNRFFKYLNIIAVTCLLVLCIYMSFKVGTMTKVTHNISNDIRFSLAIEMAISMPISWLPVVADYLQNSDVPLKDASISVIAYNIASIWMYAIGLFIALYTNEHNIANIIKNMGLPLIGLFIVLLSSVTTTYLDAYSSGESFTALYKKGNAKKIAIIFTVLATIISAVFPIYNLTPFLTFIGSIFVPMVAVMITDYYLFKKPGDNKMAMAIWLVGVMIYHITNKYQLFLGPTITSLILVVGLRIIFRKYQISNRHS